MDFKIKSIIIWPKNEQNKIRTIDFSLDKVNVITGGSEKGKSAIISIIDYCLGSGTCRIPTRIIRDKSAWFGVLFSVSGNELLLVRKEAGQEQVSNEMFMKEATKVEIPINIIANCNVDDVKGRLDNIGKLSDLSLNSEYDNKGFASRPSFRDLTSFLFQPQYIIANQSTLFYRADSFAHREKLKNIFPYIFKAVNNEYLELQDELKEIERKLNLLNKEHDRRAKYVTKWLGQLRGFYLQAKEFGLLKHEPYPEDDWKNNNYLVPLRAIQIEVDKNVIPLPEIDSITKTSERLSKLTNNELEVAYQINQLKHRQELIKRIMESNRLYRDNLLNQDNRLGIASWFNALLKKEDDKCPFCGTHSNEAKKYITNLVETRNDVIEKGFRLNDNYSVLSGEYKKVSVELDGLLQNLNNIRAEIEALKSESKEDNDKLHTLNSIYQFAGKLQAEIGSYDSINSNDDLVGEIKRLMDRRTAIEQKINFNAIQVRVERAKRKIAEGIKFYADIFKAENRTEVIEFNERDLTVNFIPKSGRREALYEIGSGHNYMSYHLSTLLSLHEFFIENPFHPVPNFLILDQPTQVYFPESSDDENADDDMEMVKRIFEALQKAIERTKGNLQIIVLEHVGSGAWEGKDNILKLKRWRIDEQDNALIPNDWK
ncbi:MAG: DUF3732 domain-containing protein [Sphingobacteriales bacterium]|nr:MAG: DUF3732 domain-containing protein [Sphingobacteriales bacterium]